MGIGLIRICAALCGVVMLGLLAQTPAQAQVAEIREDVTYQIGPPTGGGGPRTIRARFIRPASDKPVPAVVLLHSSGGMGHSALYHGPALRAAGMATFGIDMFPSGGRPTYLEDTVPHAHGALNYLAERPEIDAARIGTMGFSWGGGLGIVLVSQSQGLQPDKPGRRFAAHVAFYPTCYVFHPAPRRRERALSPTTGAPLLILIGDRDSYEPAEQCTKLPELMAAEDRDKVTVRVFPGATHSWDIGKTEMYRDSASNMGRGGEVFVKPDKVASEESRRMSVEFFRRAFGMDG